MRKYIILGVIALSLFLFTAQPVLAVATPKSMVKSTINKIAPRPRRTSMMVSTTAFAGDPPLSFAYRFNWWTVSLKNVSSVRFTLEYTRATRTGPVSEGLQGGGKATRMGTYYKRVYAGTQSSKYFIPHTVTSGKLKLTGVRKNGSTFSVLKTFTIKNGRMTLTK